ncbi:hypothetical protein XH79_10795 [Bradyrhizobium sp. CCBAU 45389]|nr:hypothetical protein [Bradyrhizobium sp. CCBAU 45389]
MESPARIARGFSFALPADAKRSETRLTPSHAELRAGAVKPLLRASQMLWMILALAGLFAIAVR